jgi:hypothetical protein
MSAKSTAVDRLAGEPEIEAPVDNLTLFMMVLALTARVDAIESEPSARRQAAAGEDLEPRPAGDWIALKDAAFRSGKSLAWIHKYRNRGEIAEHSEGGHVLVNVESLNRAIVRSGRTQGTVKYSHHEKT